MHCIELGNNGNKCTLYINSSIIVVKDVEDKSGVEGSIAGSVPEDAQEHSHAAQSLVEVGNSQSREQIRGGETLVERNKIEEVHILVQDVLEEVRVGKVGELVPMLVLLVLAFDQKKF